MINTVIVVSLVMISRIWFVVNGPDTGTFQNHLSKLLAKNGQRIENMEPLLPIQKSDSMGLMQGGFYWLSDCKNDHCVKYVWVGRVNSCRAGGCSADSRKGNPAYEYFDYLILYDNNGRVIQVEIFNYRATRGHEITAKGWLKQFRGFDSNGSLRVGKEIDAIAGATVSVFAITTDIEYRTIALKSILSERNW